MPEMRRISTLTEGTFGSKRESSLHSGLKKWYFLEGDRLEAKVDGFMVDIARGDLLIEIQTTNFSAIKPKLKRLLRDHKVRLVHPIARKKWIVHKSTSGGEAFGRRRSPKKGALYDLFSELIRIPDLFSKGNLSIEVLMTEVEEIWRNDGRGSWRRKGASVEDRKLIRVFERVMFEDKADFLRILPNDLPNPFSNRNLSQSLGIPINQSRKVTYSLRRIGTIEHAGWNGKQMLFRVPSRPCTS
jgi:hypothetical protein